MITPIPLPYEMGSLEPYYDEETLKIHYNTLYKGYVENLNKANANLQKARDERNFENIKCLEKDLSYNGSGVILHELFFTNMAPVDRTGQISQRLVMQINRDFGNFGNFKLQFINSSKNVEASRLGNISLGAKI